MCVAATDMRDSKRNCPQTARLYIADGNTGCFYQPAASLKSKQVLARSRTDSKLPPAECRWVQADDSGARVRVGTCIANAADAEQAQLKGCKSTSKCQHQLAHLASP